MMENIVVYKKPSLIWSAFFGPVFEFLELVFDTFVGVLTPPYRFDDIMKQLDFVIVQSAPVVVFSVTFAAIVTIIEASFHMKLVIQSMLWCRVSRHF